jgi:8-oxo-dGTP pyrophosphatase MutT (NUDIX family)
MINTHIICSNCGQAGHVTKSCSQPITSFGILLFRLQPTAAATPQPEALLQTSVPQIHPEFLLIQRRDSIGFVEILRGKYKIGDDEYIRCQLRGMTRSEQEKLLTTPFDALWEDLWGPPRDSKHTYRSEKEISRAKLEELRSQTPSLRDLVAEVQSSWPTPEWGFPKGRREPHESDYACAIRETWEETGFREREYIVLRGLEPIKETFTGSNGVQYCHKYYIGYVPPDRASKPLEITKEMEREIGALAWCPLEDGITRIRPENPEKRNLLNRVAGLLRTHVPLELRGDLLSGKNKEPK